MAAPRAPLCPVSVGTPVLNIDDVVQVPEPNGATGPTVATFNVTLSRLSAAGPVSVHFATAPYPSDASHASALPDGDFVSTSGDLNFLCGEPLTKQIQVPIVDDGSDGGTLDHYIERYQVMLTQPVNATIGNGVAIGEIVDSDNTPPPPPDDCLVVVCTPIFR